MNVNEAAAERLEAAADYIDAHGWTQGSYGSFVTGKMCLMGAVNHVSGYLPFYLQSIYKINDPIWEAALSALKKAIVRCTCCHAFFTGVSIIEDHNDRCLANSAEAIKLLREAADATRFTSQ